jgi:hypothetical protein
MRPVLPFISRIVLYVCGWLSQSVGGHGFHLHTSHFYKRSERSIEVLKTIPITETVRKAEKFYDMIQEDENEEG